MKTSLEEALSYPPRLVFTTGIEPFSIFIRVASRPASLVSHVAIALGEHGQWLLHAIEPGVRLDARDEYIGSQAKFFSEYLILRDVRAGIVGGLAHVGKPYDFSEVALRSMTYFANPLLAHRVRGFDRYDMWTCARFVARTIGYAIPEWHGLPAWLLPQDLLDRTGPSFQRIG